MVKTAGIDKQGNVIAAVTLRGRGRRAVDVDLAALPRGAVVAAGLSPRTAVTAWVKAPFNNRRKALRVVPALLDIELPFPLEDCIWTVAAERAGAEGREILAVAARQADVRKRLDELASVDVDPHVLDHEGLALWSHSLETCPPGSDERYRAVCYLHAEGAVLALGERGDLRGVYTVPATGHDQLERLFVARFGRDWRAPEHPPGSVALIVCGPDVEGQARLRAAIDSPEAVRWIVPDDPERFLARALALRAARPDGPLACNLRKGPLAHPGTLGRERRALAGALLTLALAGLLAGAAGLGTRRAARVRLGVLNRTVAAEASRVAGYPVLSRGADAVNEAARAVNERLAVAPLFAQQLEPSLLTALQHVLQGVAAGEGAAIERLAFSLDGDAGLVLRVPDADALAHILGQWAVTGLRPDGPPDTRPTADGGLMVELDLVREGP